MMKKGKRIRLRKIDCREHNGEEHEEIGWVMSEVGNMEEAAVIGSHLQYKIKVKHQSITYKNCEKELEHD